MPAHTCTKCQRANPPEAVYCYYDGVVLTTSSSPGAAPAPAGPVSIGAKPFSAPFTLPNGKVCQNFDQLALTCQQNWSSAVDALKQGYLEKFMASQGRADLAQAAREAARFPDKDRGLDQFLARLPSKAIKDASLRVEPKELDLGQLKVGDTRSVPLKLVNDGMRLVYGSVTVEGGSWLTLGSGAGAPQKLFQFGSEMSLPVNIQGKRLRASNKPLEARLIVESNAGNFVINVKAEIGVKPFPSGALAGARSPRQIAEKAKANPKDSAALFVNGSVAQWYKDNGWQYPVKGQSAEGLGAVQQFFEALGLTPPPKVKPDKQAVSMRGEPGQSLPDQLEIKSDEKRPVYAHAISDQPWLEIGKPRLNGRVATIPIRVPNVPDRAGETLHAKVTVTSNGNQRFVIPVTLTIGGKFNFLAAPIAAGAPAPVVAPLRAGKDRKSGIRLLPLILLLLCLLGVVIWDLWPRGEHLAAGVPDGDPERIEKIVENAGPEPYDNENRIAVLFSDEIQRFGISITRLKDPRYPEKPKLLTRNERGNTNNTRVSIEGYKYIWGRESAGAGVRWARINGKLQKEIRDKDGRRWTSTMDYETERIRVLQSVQILVGEQTRLYDTALVKYVIWNRDDKRHTVGIRVMLDTYIGANDGVPFFIPPTEDAPAHFVTTKETFTKEKIPQFIRALESDDLNDQTGTVAELGLRLKGYETPEKLEICRWPQEFGAGEADWDWPLQAMNEPAGAPKDSCVAIYWSRLNMNPKEKRTMGFTYGLGRIAGEASVKEIVTGGGGKIRLFTGPAKVNRPFIATAYVKKGDGQNVKIKLPSGVKLHGNSQASQPVKTEPGKDYAQVSWRLVADKAGEYLLEAELDDGAKAGEKANVRDVSIFD